MKPERHAEPMANAFAESSSVYDLIYASKDYNNEARFVHELIQASAPGARTILDLGCGTGRHARWFCECGYEVTGVDASVEMLRRAFERAPEVTLSLQDIRSFDLGKKYDAVISLFHVFSYLAGEADLARAVDSISRHSRRGTVLVFDAWHGPGVLFSPPESRSITVKDGRRTVVRRAEPIVDPERKRVDVSYELAIEVDGQSKVSRELHSMRYYFREDVEPLFDAAGFEPVKYGAWLTERLPEQSDWNVYWVFRKQ